MKRPPPEPGDKSRKQSEDSEAPVGYCNPPKHSRFKPGQSGNLRGRPKTTTHLQSELTNLLRKALSRKAKLKDGDQIRSLTMAEAGIEQMVRQFCKGDPRARRDLLWFADKLGLTLSSETEHPIVETISPDHAAILDRFVQRHIPASHDPTRREYAPYELLDEDDRKDESGRTDARESDS